MISTRLHFADIFVVLEFITMSLDNGIVLPGITRDSIIQLLNDQVDGRKDFPLVGMPRKIRVVERDISMPEVVNCIDDASLKGSVGCNSVPDHDFVLDHSLSSTQNVRLRYWSRRRLNK